MTDFICLPPIQMNTCHDNVYKETSAGPRKFHLGNHEQTTHYPTPLDSKDKCFLCIFDCFVFSAAVYVEENFLPIGFLFSNGILHGSHRIIINPSAPISFCPLHITVSPCSLHASI